MTGTNHYLTGVAAAVLLKNPFVVVPVAFASHFVLDALPHFGVKVFEGRGKKLLRVAITDTIVLVGAIILTLMNYPAWYVLAGLVAMSPDFAWIYRFCIPEKFGKLPPIPENRFNAWHVSIQKLEYTWGMAIEIPYMFVVSYLLFVR